MPSFRIDLMVESLIEFNETIETLNGSPQSLPSATEVPLNCTIGILIFFVSNSILFKIFFLTDSEMTIVFEFFN